MRHASRASVLVVLAFAVLIAAPTGTALAPPTARADGAADARAAAIKELMSPDDAVRSKAAAFLVQQGQVGAEEVARHAELDDPTDAGSLKIQFSGTTPMTTAQISDKSSTTERAVQMDFFENRTYN